MKAKRRFNKRAATPIEDCDIDDFMAAEYVYVAA